jgi:hypothetical protein
MQISIIHPTRHRVEQAIKTRSNWLSRADGEVEYLFSTDSDDTFPLGSVVGDNKTAIEAINRAAKLATGDLLIVVSDDFSEPPENWDTLLLMELEGQSDFVVKTRDGIQPVLVTLPIMDRVYYEQFGYIYHPEYKHMYSDTEMTTVALMLGRVITSDLLFEHRHYSTGKTPMDAINKKNDATYKQGERVFNRHLKNNFGIKNPLIQFKDIVWH